MVYKFVVLAALVAVASAGLISSPLGLAAPQIALGGLPIGSAGLINNIGLASPLLRSQVIAGPAISHQVISSPVLRSQIIPQQLIAAAPQQLIAHPQQIIAHPQQQLIASPVLRSHVISQQLIAAPQQLIAHPQQLIAHPQQHLIASPVLRSQIIPQQIIAHPQQLIAAPQVIAAPAAISQQQIISAPVLRSQIIPQQHIIAAAPQVLAKAVVANDEYDPNPQYSFAYDVQDALTGDNKNQQETRSGDVVQGSYSLNDPDGTRRTVDYTADPVNGFNAVVRKEPLGVAVKAVAAAPLVAAASPLGLHASILA